MHQPCQSVRELAAAVWHGDTTARAVVQACLERIDALDPRLGALLEVRGDQALRRAEEVDAKVARGEATGALAGVPVAIKDNICTVGGKTTCGSRMLADYRSPYSAHVVERLEEAGAIIVGKTNLDEFGMGSSTETSAFVKTRNPWHPDYVAGGSSGGSAVAVATGMVPVALGTDTGGSVRQPAGFCGVVGLKPTYGRVSRFGLVAYGSSLDQIGVMGRDVVDVAAVLNVVAGHDSRDSTCVDRPVPDYASGLAEPMDSVRVGVAREYFGDGLDPEVRSCVEQAVGVYREAGAVVRELSLPHIDFCIATYYVVATAEASSNLARFDGVHYGRRTSSPRDLFHLYAASRAEGFGPEVKRRIMLGTYALSSGYYDTYYLTALKVRTLIRRDFEKALAEADVLIGPTSPVAGFRFGERVDDPLAMYLADVYTVAASLTGLPAISVPCGFNAAGLPIGLQLIGRPFSEDHLLRIAHEYQKCTDWHTKRPPIC